MSFINELEGLIVSKLGTIQSLIAISKLEGRLAGLSIVPFLVCILSSLVILTGVWIVSMAILGYLAWLYLGNVIYSLILVLLTNILLLVIFKRWALANLRKMSFAKTREYVDEVLTITEKVKNAGTEEDSDRDFVSRKEIADSATKS